MTDTEVEIMWKDALGATFKTGDRVAYYRSPGSAGGGSLVVTGVVVGPAKNSGNDWITLDLSDSSLELLERLRKMTKRKRPVSRRVHSLYAGSCIVINGHPSSSKD